jgi:hypothetical protein
MRRRLWAAIFGLAALLGWSGCSAPHDNALDPGSQHYVAPSLPAANLSGRARSLHISRKFGSDTYSVICELFGSDAARQDSAWVSFNGQDSVSLSRTDPATLSTVFAASYFGDTRLSSVLGCPFTYQSKDNGGASHVIGPVFMWRVIESSPALTSPSGDDTTDAHPKLTWNAFSAAYPFGYRADVVNLTDGFETAAWTSPLLHDSILHVECPDSLPEGEYYWTIAVVDCFQNSSRSKEGTFTVHE